MEYRDRAHWEEELEKSLQADMKQSAEELSKAAANVGSGGNDASGKTPMRKAWSKKATKLEGTVDRLSTISQNKPSGHPVHDTLARAEKELDAHHDNHPG